MAAEKMLNLTSKEGEVYEASFDIMKTSVLINTMLEADGKASVTGSHSIRNLHGFIPFFSLIY
jgi:hypothetical protein